MLRGNHQARVDDKGRLKIPNGFRALVETQFGAELFVTSVTGEHVVIYPLAVWTEIERKLAAVPSTNPSKRRFLERVNFFGQIATMDKQGRVLLPQVVRDPAGMIGDVNVLGQLNHLEVWNSKRFLDRLKREPFSEDDGKALAGFGI